MYDTYEDFGDVSVSVERVTANQVRVNPGKGVVMITFQTPVHAAVFRSPTLATYGMVGPDGDVKPYIATDQDPLVALYPQPMTLFGAYTADHAEHQSYRVLGCRISYENGYPSINEYSFTYNSFDNSLTGNPDKPVNALFITAWPGQALTVTWRGLNE